MRKLAGGAEHIPKSLDSKTHLLPTQAANSLEEENAPNDDFVTQILQHLRQEPSSK
jgi:hypothetical protein